MALGLNDAVHSLIALRGIVGKRLAVGTRRRRRLQQPSQRSQAWSRILFQEG